MTTVYILSKAIDYEGDRILGIYATEEVALEALLKAKEEYSYYKWKRKGDWAFRDSPVTIEVVAHEVLDHV